MQTEKNSERYFTVYKFEADRALLAGGIDIINAL